MQPVSNKRARAAACTTCRVRKRRCLPANSDPNGPCKLCLSLSTPCSIAQTTNGISPFRRHDIVAQIEPKATAEPSSSLLSDPSVVQHLIDLYFRLIHDGPHTLFHEPSFTRQVSSNDAPPILMLSIIAISARFAKIPLFQDMDPRVRGRVYAKEAMELLQENLIKPSLVTIQACILLSQYLGSEGDVKGKHIYVGLAMLHSQAIRLWEMTRQSDTVSREICRRTWLSVVICDRWSAADMATSPTYSGKYRDNFPLLDEKEFVELSTNSNGLREILNPSGNGLWAQMAKTIDTFRRISEMIYSLGSNSTSASVQEDNVISLAGQLDRWASELPPRLVYTKENLGYFTSVGFGKTFLAMHIGYHHFRQLLYFPFLDSLRRSSNSRHLNYVELCKSNAMHVSNIADISFRTDSCHLLYYIIGHILVVSSGVHLHTLLFSSPQEAEQARGHLVSNFEILMRLKTYWPVIDISVSRLRTFQDDCRKSMTDPFTLDNWMLKFLIEHSAVLDSDRWPLPEPASDSDEQSPNTRPFEAMESEETGNTTLGSLSALVSDKNLSNDALVENALSWLLD